MSTADSPATGLVEHLFRHQSGRMLATLTRIFGPQHLALAEEVVQESLLKALQQWPFSGIPENPTAWLIQVARNAALDRLRRDRWLQCREEDIRQSFPLLASPQKDSPNSLAEDELGLMLLCAHPQLPEEARVALTLKSVMGFGVGEIARALLSSEAAIAQRLVRAKRQIREEQLRFELPDGPEWEGRLDTVLGVIYLVFNEGYSAHAGKQLLRIDLCEEAIRLAKLLTQHPSADRPETHALLSLLLLQSARLPGRVDEAGDLLLLEDQDRRRWNWTRIGEGLRALDRSSQGDRLTAYHLEAGIAAEHVAAGEAGPDWDRIADLYESLALLRPSPVVEVNRAVALARSQGPESGLLLLSQIAGHPALRRYHLFRAVEADLWARAGCPDRAAASYRAALACSCTDPERRLLARRLLELDPKRSFPE